MVDDTLPGGVQTPEAVAEQFVVEATRLASGDIRRRPQECRLEAAGHWARERLDELNSLGRHREALSIVLLAVNLTDDPRLLCQIGAGQLEDLVLTRGVELIDALETAAVTSHHLRLALGCVWATHSPVQTRIEAIAERPST